MTSTAPAFYRSLRDSQRLLLARDEVRWAPDLDAEPPTADVVVDFGCGLQLTPHVMSETVDVLSVLGVRAVPVAGPQWCCGMPVEDDQPGGGTAVVRASVRRIARYQPQTSVQVCGAWWPQTGKLRNLGEVIPFEMAHMGEFMMNAIRSRLDDIEWRDQPRTRVLLHLKGQDMTPEERIERVASLNSTDGCIPEILRMIPSVEIVGEIDAPTLGAPCQATGDDDHSVLRDVTAEEREEVRRELADQAERAGADVLVCAHQLCFREWGKFASDRLPIRHYMSVLADALGVARPDRFHMCWALPTVDDIVEEIRPAWQSWGMGRDEAESAARVIFPSHRLAP